MPKTGKINAALTSPFYDNNRNASALIAVAAVLLYLPTLLYGFSPMDEQWVFLRHREYMSNLAHIPALFHSSTLGMYYRPVWTSSFVFDMALGHGSPLLFHLTNVLLHAACAVLVAQFLRLITQDRAIAFFGGLLFALHPINIHTVAWIPGRNDSLLCLFALLSANQLLLFLRDGKRGHLLFHFMFFAGSLLTKENAIVLPALYALLLLLFRKEKGKRQLLLFTVSWIVMTIGWFFLRKSLIDYFPSITAAAAGKSLLNFFSALLLHTGKSVLPVQQSVLPVLNDTPLLPFFIAVTVIALLMAKYGVRDKRIAVMGFCWFLFFIAIPAWVGATNTNGEHYEHRVYTSMAGMLLLLSQLQLPVKTKTIRTAIVAISLLFALKTWTREPVYKNELSFITAGTQESPSVHFFHDLLANQQAEEKNFTEAMKQYDEAIRLNPNRPEFYNNRGNAYFRQKNYTAALQDYNKVLQLDSQQTETYVNRSMTRYWLKDYDGAAEDLLTAQRLGAKDISMSYVNNLNKALQFREIATINAKLKNDSLDADLYNDRGIAWLRMNEFRNALDDFNTAIRLSPHSKAFVSNRDTALALLKRH